MPVKSPTKSLYSVHPSLSMVDIGFALRDRRPTGRLVDTGGFAKKNRITHRIPITSVDEIDQDIARWLKTAYDLDDAR